jgi:hypothetical protein
MNEFVLCPHNEVTSICPLCKYNVKKEKRVEYLLRIGFDGESYDEE